MGSIQLPVTMTSTSLGLTRVLAILGMVASSLALAPVLYTHLTHRDHSTLLPWLSELQEVLLVEYHKKSITMTTLESLQGCLNTIGENAIIGSLVVVCFAASNILLDFLLLIGACCGVRCLLLPWLLFTMLQIILLGCPTVISFSLLGTYLLLQGQFLFSLLSFSAPTFLVLVAMSVWLTVLAAYWALAAKPSHEYSKATAKARLAQLDGYKVDTKGHGGHSRKPRKRNPDGHGHHGGGGGHGHHPANNVHLYPTLPLA